MFDIVAVVDFLAWQHLGAALGQHMIDLYAYAYIKYVYAYNLFTIFALNWQARRNVKSSAKIAERQLT